MSDEMKPLRPADRELIDLLLENYRLFGDIDMDDSDLDPRSRRSRGLVANDDPDLDLYDGQIPPDRQGWWR